jgi:hypothetical protein
VALVRSQVNALLMATPSYHALPPRARRGIADRLVGIAAYAAECMRDICWQSDRLGQVPVLRQRRRPVAAALARAQETGRFAPLAADQIGRITEQTLRAVAFPRFVADLIWGTFNAISQTTIQQMESFAKLLANVTKTVDQFMQDNISDGQAHEWLAQSYPLHIRLQDGRAVVRDEAGERPPPNFRADLNLVDDVSLDDGSIEETLVPAARRRLAETRLQLLSTLVLMGVNRIVVTGGKIRATMGFHIDTTDRARAEEATDLDFRLAAAAQFNWGWGSASVSTSLTYVRSTRASSDAELNVDTDLTGEVELHFKSDYFPVERFATAHSLRRVQENTAAPGANPIPDAPAPFAAPPEVGGEVGRYTSPRTRRSERAAPLLRRIGDALPDARLPVEPTAPAPVRAVPARPEGESGRSDESGAGAEPVPEERAADGAGAGDRAAGEGGDDGPAHAEPSAETRSPERGAERSAGERQPGSAEAPGHNPPPRSSQRKAAGSRDPQRTPLGDGAQAEAGAPG